MTSVGVRELRQQASELLRRVERGETIEVTDRGRPVALLTPLPRVDGMAELRSAGLVETARADFDALPEPLVVDGVLSPSEVLAALRHDER